MYDYKAVEIQQAFWAVRAMIPHITSHLLQKPSLEFPSLQSRRLAPAAPEQLSKQVPEYSVFIGLRIP